jgi:uncharacterized Zn-binding protein involved in type VI secretion
MPQVARVGDAGSHGGAIVTGSEDVLTNNLGTARVGDTYACPIHGSNAIVTGSPDTFANDQPVARVGDQTACGAVIISGSPDTFAN